MTDKTAVTSFSPQGYKVYGRRFLKTFLKHWDLDLQIFYEGPPPDDDLAKHPRLHWRDLDKDEARNAFIKREQDPVTLSGSYIRGAIKWCNKVFAITNSDLPPSEWLIWIDADVETKTPCKDEFLAKVCPDNADVVFLGRPWAYASETGFVSYRMSAKPVQELLAMMRHYYVSGNYRAFPNWGDGYLFDRAREATGGFRELDLASECEAAGLHVWPETLLGPYMQHNKGPIAKSDRYGSTL